MTMSEHNDISPLAENSGVTVAVPHQRSHRSSEALEALLRVIAEHLTRDA
jgi:hypothetical protein